MEGDGGREAAFSRHLMWKLPPPHAFNVEAAAPTFIQCGGCRPHTPAGPPSELHSPFYRAYRSIVPPESNNQWGVVRREIGAWSARLIRVAAEAARSDGGRGCFLPPYPPIGGTLSSV